MENISLAKISRPYAGDILVRERLYTVLDKERNKPLVWVVGPAGAGKTTLVSGWVDDRKLPCLWYRMDEGDADLSSFFYYLGSAGAAANPRKKHSLPLLTSEYLAGVAVFARRFFEQLFTRLKNPSVLVFDNYQDLPVDSPLHDLLVKGCESLPAGITMIILSRNEPPASCARLRADRKIGFVDWNRLRFLPEEMTGLMRSTWGGISVPDGALDALYERTGGWAAGIILVMERLRMLEGDDRAGTMAQHRALHPELHYQAVFDYFATELFDRLNEELCLFLLRTAFLPSMTEAMAERLTKQENAGRILGGLSRNHEFTEMHPGREPVFQYHPLFREFLLARARDRFSAGESSAIMTEAAGLLEEAGRTEEAFELFRDAGETDAVIRLILDHAAALLSQGRNGTLGKWLATIPAERLGQDPNLLRIAGICRLPFNLAEARSFLERSCALLDELQEQPTAVIAAYGCLMEAIIFEGESLFMLDHCLDRAHALAQQAPAAASEVEMIAGTALFAIAFHCPDHPTLSFWLTHAETAVTKPHTVAGLLKLCNHLMAYYLFVGEFNRMTWLMETLRPYRKEAEKVPVLRLLCILMEGYYCAYVKGDETGGVAMARQGMALARESGVAVYNFYFSFLITAASIHRGELETAAEFLDGMVPVGYPASASMQGDVQYLRGALALRSGSAAEALTHFNAGVELASRAGRPISETLYKINAARACFAMGRTEDALRYLQQAAQRNWGGSRVGAFMGLCSEALFHFRLQNEADGRRTLAEALAAGREGGLFILPFWDPSKMASVCGEALKNGIETGYVGEFIHRHNLVPGDDLPIEEWPYPVKIRLFGSFGIWRNGKPLQFPGKVQKKPLEMLKALAAFGETDVPQERIIDALWPEAEGDSGNSSFKFTLHQLRKLLGDDSCIQVREGRVTVNHQVCYTDVWTFQCLVQRVKTAQSQQEQIGDVCESLISAAIGIYRGDFLGDDRCQPWIVQARDRLKGQFLHLIDTLHIGYEKAGQWEKAALLCERGLEAYEQDENLYRRLMLCLLKLDRPSEALAAFSRCCRMLAHHQLDAPSAETVELSRIASRKMLPSDV